MDQQEGGSAGSASANVGRTSNWTLIRDAAVFQLKLVIDGFRDLVLIPASFVAALMSLFSSRDGRPGPQFYRLLGVGKQSERWIDLFAAYRRAPQEFVGDVRDTESNIDDIVHRVESFVVDEYRRGGVTKQAKDRIDAALGALQRRQKRSDEQE
ncbi:MAG: hypothetical protein R3288_16220 [Woeseiaceae bacterium]|nr:hypothetical protein [Woeseiaceae bacterium]